jgi:L-asparagine transporter-like permease
MFPALLTYINFVSVKLFIRVQNVFTVSKLLACLIVIIGGVYKLCAGEFWVRTWPTMAIRKNQRGKGVMLINLSLQKRRKTEDVK